jgi:hypothetical protein
MKNDLLSLVPFKLALIIINDDLKDIRNGLAPTNVNSAKLHSKKPLQ